MLQTWTDSFPDGREDETVLCSVQEAPSVFNSCNIPRKAFTQIRKFTNFFERGVMKGVISFLTNSVQVTAQNSFSTGTVLGTIEQVGKEAECSIKAAVDQLSGTDRTACKDGSFGPFSVSQFEFTFYQIQAHLVFSSHSCCSILTDTIHFQISSLHFANHRKSIFIGYSIIHGPCGLMDKASDFGSEDCSSTNSGSVKFNLECFCVFYLDGTVNGSRDLLIELKKSLGELEKSWWLSGGNNPPGAAQKNRKCLLSLLVHSVRLTSFSLSAGLNYLRILRDLQESDTTLAGLEPAIFGSEVRRLIHWATGPLVPGTDESCWPKDAAVSDSELPDDRMSMMAQLRQETPVIERDESNC
uniref:Uncharacterized protein n=1 Tax=Setaria digitata TaxID=48799 RepID=A0A915PIK6_9BILA